MNDTPRTPQETEQYNKGELPWPCSCGKLLYRDEYHDHLNDGTKTTPCTHEQIMQRKRPLSN